MANFVYTHAKFLFLKGDLDFDTLDGRFILVMTNTTADTEKDVDTVGAFTTLDECDASGYTAATGYALASEAITEDEPNDRGEFDAGDLSFGAIGSPSAGTRQVQGMVFIKKETVFADSIPLAWYDTVSGGPGFPFWPNGGTVTSVWNAEGILQVT